MKKFIMAVAVMLVTIAGITEVKAQAGLFFQGKYVRFIHPREIAASKDATFPTFISTTVPYRADSMAYKVVEHSTYLRPDSIGTTTTLWLTVSEYVKGGAQLIIHPTKSDSSNKTLYIRQGNTYVDTILVNGSKIKRSYLYTGSVFEKY